MAQRDNDRRPRPTAAKLPEESAEPATTAERPARSEAAPTSASTTTAGANPFQTALVNTLIQSGSAGPGLALSILRAMRWRFWVFARRADSTEVPDPNTAFEIPILTGVMKGLDRESDPFHGGVDLPLAILLGKPAAELTHKDRLSVVENLEILACTDAYLDELAHDLETAGCRTEDIPTYLKRSGEILSRLLSLASETAPKPSELRRLVLSFALNTAPITGDIRRFSWIPGYRSPPSDRPFPAVYRRDPSTLNLCEYTPGSQEERLIKNPFAIWLLDCIGLDRVDIPRLRDVVEQIHDGAADETTLGFFFQIGQDPKGNVQVRLWIGDNAVSLKSWQNIHKLLRLLCTHPTKSYAGAVLKKKHGITNPSMATNEIKKSLEASRPGVSGAGGAGGWLLTNPISWKDGHAPRQKSAQRGGRQ